MTFGPYRDACAFDRYVVYRGTDPILVVPEESRVRMPPGVEFTWTPVMCGMDAVREEWSRAIAEPVG